MTQLRLLGRSGTGQRITVYTTFITGPTPGHEMHIVLVDNGRRSMRAMPEFREALHCIRCGACANVCPPYREVGGHVFGHIYTGAIGLVVTPFHHGLDADRQTAEPLPLLQRLRDGLPGRDPAAAPDPRRAQDGRRREGPAGGEAGRPRRLRPPARVRPGDPDRQPGAVPADPAAAGSSAGGTCRS